MYFIEYENLHFDNEQYIHNWDPFEKVSPNFHALDGRDCMD